MRGRSPRGRGRRPVDQCGFRQAGKIPARAGTTTPTICTRSTTREDPRAGGDDTVTEPASAAPAGRSPRGRGRPRFLLRSSRRSGKIPARAGTTEGRRRPSAPGAEDPRAGGDDTGFYIIGGSVTGRSPRGRGRQPAQPLHLMGHRKIPARAGTTSSGSRSRRWPVEDPRAGGDDSASAPVAPRRAGRSPRGRGRPPAIL